MKTKEPLNILKKHEGKYWHIPKFSILPLLLMLVFISLSIINFMFIISEWQRLGLGVLECSEENCYYSWNMLSIIYPIFFEYVFISLAFISLSAMIKGEYKNLKNYKEDGLIGGLIVGLIGGLIIGLIVGLIVRLIGGLIIGLIVGLIIGLTIEFER